MSDDSKSIIAGLIVLACIVAFAAHAMNTSDQPAPAPTPTVEMTK